MKRALYLILGLSYALHADSFKDVLAKGDYIFLIKRWFRPSNAMRIDRRFI
ncbi:hypothetical protein VN0918_14960 [Helicobacter pylori]